MVNLKSIFFPHTDDVLYLPEAIEKFPKLNFDHILNGMQPHVNGDVSELAKVSRQVFIGEGSTIHPFVVIEEEVMIGDNCEIRPGAYIRSGTIIGDNCIIGHNAEIKESFIADDAKVAGNCFVGNSIIGKGARLGTGVILSNRRFDQKPIWWQLGASRVETAHQLLGALIGDYARLGAGVITNPGTTIGAYSWVSAANAITGHIPEKTFVKPTGEIVENQSPMKLK